MSKKIKEVGSRCRNRISLSILFFKKDGLVITLLEIKKFFAVAAVAMGGMYYGLVTCVVPDYIQKLLPTAEGIAQEYINGTVKLGGMTWNGGLTAYVHDVEVYDLRQEKIVTLPQVEVQLRPWLALIDPVKVVSRITLEHPQVNLVMTEDKGWNFSQLLKPSDSTETPFYGLLDVHQGQLLVQMPGGSHSFTVDALVNGGANPDFAVDATVHAGQDVLQLQGVLTTDGVGNLTLKTDKLDLVPYAGVLKHFENVHVTKGSIQKFNLKWENDGKRILLSGEGDLQQVASKIYFQEGWHQLELDGFLRIADNVLSLKGFKAGLDKQQVELDGEINLAQLDGLASVEGKGVVRAQELSWKNWHVKQVEIPFTADGDNITLEDAHLTYGGGLVEVTGNYNIKEQVLLATVQAAGLTHPLGSFSANPLTLNGKAVVCLQQQDDGGMAVQLATEACDLGWCNLQIKKLALDGSWSDNQLELKHFSAMTQGDGNLVAKGNVTFTGDMTLEGRMSDFPIGPFMNLGGQQGEGICSTGFKLTGNVQAPEFAGTIQLNKVKAFNQNIKEAHGWIGLAGNSLKIKQFKAQMEQGSHTLNGVVDWNGPKTTVDLSLMTEQVRVEPLAALAGVQTKLTGNLDNYVTMKGPLDNLDVVGNVRIQDGSAAGYLVDRLQGHYTYHDGQLTLTDGSLDALSAQVNFNGTMDKQQNLDFDMQATGINLQRLPIVDEDYLVRGYVDFNGKLLGTLSNPFFKGDIASEAINFNGELLTDVAGEVLSNTKETNKLDIKFKQPYFDDSGDYGLFTADININLVEKYFHGKVNTLWGKLGGILAMARQDYAIDGIAQGELRINPKGKDSGAEIDFTVDKVKIHDIPYHRMVCKGFMNHGVLKFDDVKLQEQPDVDDKGIIVVGGKVDFKEQNLDVAITSVQADPAIFTVVMENPPKITGEMDGQIYVNGGLANPSGKAEISINNGSISGVALDNVTASLSMADDNVRLNDLIISKDVYSLQAKGDLPLDLLRAPENRRKKDAQMNVKINIDEARLGMLPVFTDQVEEAQGDVKGSINVAGTLEEPLIYGQAKIENGSIKLKQLDTVIDKINTDVDFKGNEIVWNNFSTQLGKGTFTANGTYAMRAKAEDSYRLYLQAKDAELESEIFTGRINGDIEIVPQEYVDYNQHQVDGAFPKAFRPVVRGNVQLDDVMINMPTIPEFGEGNSNIGLDLRVNLGKKVHLYNKYLYDIWLKGHMDMQGSTLYPIIDGRIGAEKGSITYLRTPFKLKEAEVSWVVPGSFLPNVNINGQARFSRYDVALRVTGPLEEMDLQLTSNPPLSRNTLVRMLTLQRDTEGSGDVTSDDIQNLMTAGLQMTILGDVEMLVKQTLGLDQFRIYMGEVRSGIGFSKTGKNDAQELTEEEKNQYNLLVSKYLGDKFMVGYTTSFDGVDRSVFGQYDINKRMNITYSRSYDISDDADNWCGLEYKVTF